MIEFQVTEGVIPKLIGGMNLLNAFDICLHRNNKKSMFKGNERDPETLENL